MSSFCGLPENLEGVAGFGMSQWARGKVITWRVDSAPPGFSVADLDNVVSDAFRLWRDVSDVRFDKATGSPNIVVYSQRIDGPRGVLAQAQLPQPNQQAGTLTMQLDHTESFVRADNPPQGRIDILRVVCHELGHNLGLGHAPAQSPNLMAPSISDVRRPMPGWDIPQIVARYGERSTSPNPPVPSDPDPTDELVGILRRLLADCSEARIRRAVRALRESGL